MGVVRVKDSVRFDCVLPRGVRGLAPAGIRIISAIDRAAAAMERDVTISCGTEEHGPADPHTLGEALDVSLNGFTTEIILNLFTFLTTTLGPLFTVLLETNTPFTDPMLSKVQYLNPHATGPHLHIQKRKGTVFPPVPDGTVNV